MYLNLQAHPDPYGGKAVQVRWMWEELHSEIHPGLPREDAHRSVLYHKNYHTEEPLYYLK